MNMNYFFIIAHTPLANALRDCVLHVFPDTSEYIVALDILPNSAPQDALHTAQLSIKQLFALPKTTRPNGIVVFTDLFGATPSNIATELVDGTHVKLVAGVNLPMLLKRSQLSARVY
jgi:PTS system mannose-specific IIA component